MQGHPKTVIFNILLVLVFGGCLFKERSNRQRHMIG